MTKEEEINKSRDRLIAIINKKYKELGLSLITRSNDEGDEFFGYLENKYKKEHCSLKGCRICKSRKIICDTWEIAEEIREKARLKKRYEALKKKKSE